LETLSHCIVIFILVFCWMTFIFSCLIIPEQLHIWMAKQPVYFLHIFININVYNIWITCSNALRSFISCTFTCFWHKHTAPLKKELAWEILEIKHWWKLDCSISLCLLPATCVQFVLMLMCCNRLRLYSRGYKLYKKVPLLK
jgi:hypothetical protein